jgi:hypothetical protein
VILRVSLPVVPACLMLKANCDLAFKFASGSYLPDAQSNCDLAYKFASGSYLLKTKENHNPLRELEGGVCVLHRRSMSCHLAATLYLLCPPLLMTSAHFVTAAHANPMLMTVTNCDCCACKPPCR